MASFRGLIRSAHEDPSLAFGMIRNPVQDASRRFGGSWTIESVEEVEMFHPLAMSAFGATSHCTLTALTAIFLTFRRQGYIRVESDEQELFAMIRAIGEAHHWFRSGVGTFPWDMARLTRQIWRDFGYAGTAKNRFLFRSSETLQRTIEQEIRAQRPGIISFTHGRYPDHSVTFYGILKLRRTDRPSSSAADVQSYLLINDHWSVERRYVLLEHLGEGRETYFSLCLMRP